MFGFKKKEQKPVGFAAAVEAPKPIDPEIEVKLQVLQNLVLEQRAMIRQLLKITTMLAEHKRYELIQVELHKLSNALDKIK